MFNHLAASFAPTETYPRHSEGAFLRLKDGGILLVYSRYTGGSSDDSSADLAACVSYDEGESWSEPVTTLKAEMYNTRNVMSVSLMRMNNGDVGMFYIVKQTPCINRLMLSRSNDEGKTWYKHVECTLPDRAGYYELNNDRAERLSSGRILLPVDYYRGGYDTVFKSAVHWDGRAFVTCLFSDDDGETWQEAADAVYPPFPHTRAGLQEVGAVEKKNGVIWGYARTDMMYQYEYFSMDGGNHWTEAQPSRFTSPESPMKIKRNPFTGDLYAVWNPIPQYNGRKERFGLDRSPIVWAVSKDDGATWSDCHVIEESPVCGYCYPAIFFTDDGYMMCAYCAGSIDDGGCLNRLNIYKVAI